jgi:hypothetical protein
VLFFVVFSLFVSCRASGQILPPIISGKPAVIVLVRTPDNGEATGAARTIAVSLGSNSTSGNLLVGIFGGETALCGTSSPTVSDTVGTIYTVALKVASTSAETAWALYGYAGGTGANTVTVDFGLGITCTYRALTVAEYSGVGALDQSVADKGENTAADSGAMSTTTNPKDLLFCGVRSFDNGKTFIHGKYNATDFYGIQFQGSTVDSKVVGDAKVAATGVYHCRMTISATTRWVAHALAFKGI